MRFRGIIFDLDGTLVDSIEDLADSMNTVLRSNNLPVHELQAYKYFVGNGIRNLVRRAIPEKERSEELITKCYQSMIETYRDNCMNKTKPYDGIPDLLNELTARNMKLAVFSNKAHELTKKIVSELLPYWNFEVVKGLSDEALKKPSPVGALQISKAFGIIPEEIVYLGDTGVDMETANKAGMYPVGVLWGFRTKEELTATGAKYILNSPMDLIQIL